MDAPLRPSHRCLQMLWGHGLYRQASRSANTPQQSSSQSWHHQGHHAGGWMGGGSCELHQHPHLMSPCQLLQNIIMLPTTTCKRRSPQPRRTQEAFRASGPSGGRPVFYKTAQQQQLLSCTHMNMMTVKPYQPRLFIAVLMDLMNPHKPHKRQLHKGPTDTSCSCC